MLRATELDRKLDAVARDLSHGEQQALELAMVLALAPRIVLLDEPTAGLSKHERARIGDILVSLAHRHGLCCLLVEHDLDFVEQVATRIVVLHQGADRHGRQLRRRWLDPNWSRPSMRERGRRGGGAMSGFARPPEEPAPSSGKAAARRQEGKPMIGLKLDGVTSGYGASVVLRGLSMEVAVRARPWPCWARTAWRKSTLLKTVMGYLPKQAGTVVLNGEDITRLAPHRVARKGVAYAAQEQAIFTELSVRDNLRLGLAREADFPARFAAVEPLFPVFKRQAAAAGGHACRAASRKCCWWRGR